MSNKQHYRQLARWDLSLHINDDGTASLETLRTAAIFDIAESLRAIRADIRSLGADGIHQVLRLMLKKLNRAAARERDRRRALRKAVVAKKRPRRTAGHRSRRQ